MALFTPSESPAVVVREIDLTGGVPNVQSTTGALAGNFRWGPAEKRVLIANEAELVNNFGSPSDSSSVDFLSASQFLRYSGSLQTVRMVSTDAYNAVSTNRGQAGFDSAALLNTQIKNADAFDAGLAGLDSDGHTFISKYPGAIGNTLRTSMCPADATEFASWPYNDYFDAAPGTSSFASGLGASNDEVHVAILDIYGYFTGTPGSVLETYNNLSAGKNAIKDDGTNNYVIDVINERSEFVWMVGFDSSHTNAGTDITNLKVFNSGATWGHYLLTGASNGTALTVGNYQTGFDLFEDKDQVEVDFLISPSMSARADQTTIVNDLVSTASSLRKDCVVVASPARSDIINVTSDATKVSNTVLTADTFTKSSYLVADNNFLKVYDKYNDKYVFIPAASTVAGAMALTDINRAAWFSPAGSRRGQMLGITSLAYSPTKGQRDTLYKAGVNPIANIPGQGALLFGDKTMLGRPSAFDRINVRRLFLILERAIGRAAEQVMFEFNDEFTRAEFVNIVEPVLREVQGRRGITDFRVVCDETNNTPTVIDRNEFKADIFIKPARSINYVTLSFVAVRTGVDFEEVVGTV